MRKYNFIMFGFHKIVTLLELTGIFSKLTNHVILNLFFFANNLQITYLLDCVIETVLYPFISINQNKSLINCLKYYSHNSKAKANPREA